MVVTTSFFEKKLRLHRFKSNRDKIWQDCSPIKYVLLDESDFGYDVMLSRWRQWRHFVKSL